MTIYLSRPGTFDQADYAETCLRTMGLLRKCDSHDAWFFNFSDGVSSGDDKILLHDPREDRLYEDLIRTYNLDRRLSMVHLGRPGLHQHFLSRSELLKAFETIIQRTFPYCRECSRESEMKEAVKGMGKNTDLEVAVRAVAESQLLLRSCWQHCDTWLRESRAEVDRSDSRTIFRSLATCNPVLSRRIGNPGALRTILNKLLDRYPQKCPQCKAGVPPRYRVTVGIGQVGIRCPQMPKTVSGMKNRQGRKRQVGLGAARR
jgi:hypothetical protein